MKQVLQTWKSMIDKGYFAKPVLYSDLYKDFAKGQDAIIIEPSSAVSSLVKDYGMASGTDVDAFVLPNVRSDGKGVIFFEAAPICVSQNSKGKTSALAALRSFYKPATQKVMVEENGIANTSAVPIGDKTIQNIITMSTDSGKNELILRYYENTPSDVRDVALTALSKFMDGAAGIDETLNTIQAKADDVFQK
jgi:multiple sugar transport system substrate-binding protein